MTRLFACLLAWSWLMPIADAATLGGATLPDTYTVDGQTLVLNGIGLRTLTIFSVKVYVAGLYLKKPSHDAQQILASPDPKAIILRFIHSGSKADVEKEYRAGEALNCGDGSCPTSAQADFEKLVAAAPGVNPGDISTYIYTARGVRVLANNRVIGDFANPPLARQLLAGFLGPHPPSEALRNQMLGLQGN